MVRLVRVWVSFWPTPEVDWNRFCTAEKLFCRALFSVVLSTVSVLASARRIYQRAGFTLAREQPEHSYGHDLMAEDWVRSLSG